MSRQAQYLADTSLTIRNAYFSPMSKIPGPWYARLTGARLAWSVFRSNRIHYVHSLHQKYGPVVLIGPCEIDVSDPYAARDIHRMGSKFTKAPFYALLSPGPVDNIFNFRDAKLHMQRRKLYARGFTLGSLRKEWEPTVRRIVQIAVNKIKQDARTNTAEVMGWWTLMANEIVCRLTFGGGHDTVEVGVKDPFVLMLERRMGDAAHLLKHLAPPLFYIGRLLAKVIPRLHDVFYSQEKMFAAGGDVVINARSKKANGETTNLFVKALAEAEQSEEKLATLSDTDIITDAGALLLAGSDPAAISLTFMLYCVLSRPKLQKELEEACSAIEGEVTDEACERIPLLNAVIDESLRLYGAAPGCMPRSVPSEGAVLAGHYIPPQAIVNTQNWTLHRDPSIWPNPEEFDHTRWLRGLSQAQSLAFSPFGHGSRQCLGLYLGRMEMRLATAMFFRDCAGAKLAASATAESMEVYDSFIAGLPRDRRLEITMK
ncbi:putative sterigmatocystin biosynthesis P450 monooxygenase STCB [Cercospora beticola]|uniref:Putative sterigmatocystin biosynthesis P450 monooxygenase STCB n=1 Tax=Cercospora beticola TaxID=122368 RepID=A0A2G5I440_CERBT|nr:putative sterigmatocystin biosynthesis P450 monooxygenase STCB [Cercospora beticola]PIA99574.1 putative sterigmatocystin biosynthesis P450 monooxygenase STCB [Cercospora beticola]WPB00158.1 hypothetical protein RHO25_004777 [Cercospora beticola]CAK1361654.1 unnamed protein product [Cercospora beticola]